MSLPGSDIASLSDLAGKDVNLGPEGSGAALTGARLFTALGIEIKPVALDGTAAIAALQQGKIAASVVLGPQDQFRFWPSSSPALACISFRSHSRHRSKPLICR